MDMNDRPMNPYVGGGITGILVVLSAALVGKFFGASTTFARIGGLVESWVLPEHVASLAYFQKYAPKADWQLLFVIGIAVGAFLASAMTGTFKIQTVPDMWRDRFGDSAARRALFAFVGGMIAIFGARMAGGCPSGHGLSGVMQLAPGSMVSLMFFFVGGVISAGMLYGFGGGGRS
jgi:uncharacterized membrane protein YedE/YeeE